MKITDLSEEHNKTYFCCLEDWSDEMKESGDLKKNWYKEMKEKGLRVKLAIDEKTSNVVGMIQYVPIEYTSAKGNDLYLILCIWVHGYNEGVGNFQKKGFGKALLQAAEDDVKELGAKGIVAWGLTLPFWMKAKWFKKQGYLQVDKMHSQALLWKPFANNAIPPKWIRQKKTPEKEQGKVIVTSFKNGWCPDQNITFERAKRAATAPEFKGKVEFREINTMERDKYTEWGIYDGLFIDDTPVRTGPAPSYDKIYKKIVQKVKKL